MQRKDTTRLRATRRKTIKSAGVTGALAFALCAAVLLSLPQPAHAIVPPSVLYAVAAESSRITALFSFLFVSIGVMVWSYARRVLVSGRLRIAATLLIISVIGVAVWVVRQRSQFQGASLYPALSQVPGFGSEETSILQGFITEKNGFAAWTPAAILTLLHDINVKRTRDNAKPLVPRAVPLTEPREIASKDGQTVVLDVRDDYEVRAVSLPNTVRVRLGDVLAGAVRDYPKDTQIVVFCDSGVRSYVAALALIAQGYDRVSVMRGGILAWIDAGLPLENDGSVLLLPDRVPHCSEDDVRRAVSESAYGEITFGPASESSGSAVSMFPMSQQDASSYIGTLSATTQYILRCDSYHYCYDALLFWDAASARGIHTIAYTGYDFAGFPTRTTQTCPLAP